MGKPAYPKGEVKSFKARHLHETKDVQVYRVIILK